MGAVGLCFFISEFYFLCFSRGVFVATPETSRLLAGVVISGSRACVGRYQTSCRYTHLHGFSGY